MTVKNQFTVATMSYLANQQGISNMGNGQGLHCCIAKNLVEFRVGQRVLLAVQFSTENVATILSLNPNISRF